MPSFEKTIGVFGGLNGQSRSLYWNCPTCGMPYFDKCSTNPTPLTTACDLNHGTDGPTQFEVSWASIPLGGKITIDRQEILITEAFCFLFNGNLNFILATTKESAETSRLVTRSISQNFRGKPSQLPTASTPHMKIRF